MSNSQFLIGIDEAGRGPLAGPVSVGVVLWKKPIDKNIQRELKKIKGKDSKKLTYREREVWFEKIKLWKQEEKLDFHVSLISSNIIDTKGISFAIKKAIKKCLKKMNAECTSCEIRLDGSLKAPQEFVYQKTIIKGDEKEPIISLASIAAKVTRDRYMVKISKKHAEYGFEIHKGYGTKAHRTLIKTLGITPFHRKSFLKNII